METADRLGVGPRDRREVRWRFATRIAESLQPPEPVYVMDICEADNELCLLELNPFSGADLYGSKREDLVAEVSRLAAIAE